MTLWITGVVLLLCFVAFVAWTIAEVVQVRQAARHLGKTDVLIRSFLANPPEDPREFEERLAEIEERQDEFERRWPFD